MGHRRGLAAAAAAAAVTCSLLAAPAGASTGWDGGTLLHQQGTLDERRPQVVVDSGGHRHVVWEDDAADVWLGGVDAHGTVGAPVRLFDSDDDRFGGYPRIAIDSEDRLTVVWYVTDGTLERRSHVEARSISADGELGATQVLSDPVDNAYYPEVAMDDTGVATVIWENQVGGGWPGRIQAVRLQPGTGTAAGPVVTLDDPGGEVPTGIGIGDATVAMDAAGRAVVAWTRFDGAQEGNFRNATVRAVRLSADGVPGPVRAVSDDPTVDFRYPAVAVAPDGTTTIVTTRFGAVAGTVATRLSADEFLPGEPVLLSDPARETADDAAVTVDGVGRATVAWFAYGRRGVRVETRRLDAAGRPEPVRRPLGLKGGILARMELLALASDEEGRVTVAWPGADGRATRMHAVRLTTAGAPSPTQRLSSRGAADAFDEVVDAAIDDEGRVSVVWSRRGATAVRRSHPSTSAPSPADTTILGGPRDGTVVKDLTPRFRFEADTVQATFQCRLDRRRWRGCVSPFTTRELAPGRHRFEVRAVDADGTPPDPRPAVARFRVR